VAILNGAQKGVPGGGIDGGGTAKEAASQALLYDPEAPAGSRITPLASSDIHRCVCALVSSWAGLVWCGCCGRCVSCAP
jgi:hypothetical protein